MRKPLTDLLEKKTTSSGPEAFNKLKNALTSAPVLVLPDFSMPFCGRNRCMQHGNMGCFDAKEATKRLLK